jgi:hypothetical protein
VLGARRSSWRMYCGARCLNLPSCLFFFNLTFSMDTLGLVHPRRYPAHRDASLSRSSCLRHHVRYPRQLDLSIENLAILATHKTSRWSSAGAGWGIRHLFPAPRITTFLSTSTSSSPLLSHHFAALTLLVSRLVNQLRTTGRSSSQRPEHYTD